LNDERRSKEEMLEKHDVWLYSAAAFHLYCYW